MVVVVGAMVAEEDQIGRAITHVRMRRTATAEVTPNETMTHARLAPLQTRALITIITHLDSSFKCAQPTKGNISNTSSNTRTTSPRKAMVGIAVSHSLETMAMVLHSKS